MACSKQPGRLSRQWANQPTPSALPLTPQGPFLAFSLQSTEGSGGLTWPNKQIRASAAEDCLHLALSCRNRIYRFNPQPPTTSISDANTVGSRAWPGWQFYPQAFYHLQLAWHSLLSNVTPSEDQGTNWYKEKNMGFGVRSLGCKAHIIAGLFVPQFPCFYKQR